MRRGLEVCDEEWLGGVGLGGAWRCGVRSGLEVCDEEWLGGV